jgi:putative oxidoreductase
MKYLVLLGRVLYSAVFLLYGLRHFGAGTVAYAATKGVPAILVYLSGAIAVVGGLSVALGYRAKLGAWLIVIFLVPVTLVMHRFWGLADPNAVPLQQAMFFKNFSMLGTALLVTQLGSGPLSLKE